MAADRDQLWAEAAHIEATGEALELPRELFEAAAAEQAARLQVDPWQEKLEPLLDGKRGHVAVDDLWTHLGIEANRQDPGTGRRLNWIMTQLGFEKRRLTRDNSRIYAFTNDPSGGFIALPKTANGRAE